MIIPSQLMDFSLLYQNQKKGQEMMSEQVGKQELQAIFAFELSQSLDENFIDSSNVELCFKAADYIEKHLSLNHILSQNTQNTIASLTGESKSDEIKLQNFINNHRILIGTFYDLVRENNMTVDEVISSGKIKEIVNRKFGKHFLHLEKQNIRNLYIRIELIFIHILQLLEGGTHNMTIRREGNLFLDRKDCLIGETQMLRKTILSKTVCVLQNFMDFIKPAIKNYINIDTLLETSHSDYEEKSAFLKGLIKKSGIEEGELPEYYRVGKVVHLKNILPSSIKGKQMINKQLDFFDLTKFFISNKVKKSEQSQEKWSILTSIKAESYKFMCATEKLPLFLRPKSNLDVLSYLREQYIPTFRFRIIQAGFWDGPIVSQFVSVYLNCGDSPITILSFPKDQNNAFISSNYCSSFEKILSLEKKGLKYGKVQIKTDEIGVVGIGNPHIIFVNEKQIGRGQLLQWNVLPKCGQQVDSFLDICEVKEEKFNKKYLHFPKWLLLLDLLDHDFNSLNKTTFQKPINRLQQFFKEEDDRMMKLLKVKNIRIRKQKIPDVNKFCSNCMREFLNYYVVDKKEMVLCLKCGFNEKKILEVKYISNEKSLYYPLILWKILMKKGKLLLGEAVTNKYEVQFCHSEFIGAFETQFCEGSKSTCTQIKNHFMNDYKNEEILFNNLMVERQILSPEEMITKIVLKKPENEKQKQQLQKEIEFHGRWVRDKEELLKTISGKYEVGTLVCEGMWILKKLMQTGE